MDEGFYFDKSLMCMMIMTFANERHHRLCLQRQETAGSDWLTLVVGERVRRGTMLNPLSQEASELYLDGLMGGIPKHLSDLGLYFYPPGNTSFGAATPAAGGFGTPNAFGQSTPAGGLFGANPSTSTAGGLFSGGTTSFGQPSSTGRLYLHVYVMNWFKMH